jgi:hypothetical protein
MARLGLAIHEFAVAKSASALIHDDKMGKRMETRGCQGQALA